MKPSAGLLSLHLCWCDPFALLWSGRDHRCHTMQVRIRCKVCRTVCTLLHPQEEAKKLNIFSIEEAPPKGDSKRAMST